jgi:poly-gamma-glutamate capsule biosynthesis protein CapA/YwtB (metallophosphatase superfamily)
MRCLVGGNLVPTARGSTRMTVPSGTARAARRRAGRRALVGVLACLSAACTGAERPAPDVAGRPGSAPVPGSSTPASPGSAPSATSPPAGPADVPLVLAVHPTRVAVALTRGQAAAVLAARVSSWTALGAGTGTLRLVAGPAVTAVSPAGRLPSDQAALAAVERDAGVLAAVPASAVGPTVRALPVDGVDPLRAPDRYPLRLAVPQPGRAVPVTTMAVVGDIMLARRVGARIRAAGDFAYPFRATAARLAAADLTVGNLESSLSRAGAPRQGNDSFGADPGVRAGLALAGFDVLDLANNHLGDYGPTALVQTVRQLRTAGFSTVGAGANRAEARQPAVETRNGVRFGFVAFNAIGETPTAGPATPGAVSLRMPPRTGPLDAADLAALTAQVRALRPAVDVLAVLPHWGQQYTDRPVPAQRTVARALLDAGADLVLGGHPHWVQGLELHGGKLIAYSLGNFVFDMDFSRRTQEGLALELVFRGPRLVAVEPVPVRIDPAFVPRFAPGAAGLPILRAMWRVSGPPWGPAVPR